MRKFVLKTAIALMPLFFLFGVFIATDPYGIMCGTCDNESPIFRRGYSYTRTLYLQGISDSNKPNAFIIGNSKCSAYDVNEWSKRLPDSTRPFNFLGLAEGLRGSWSKLRYLDRKDYDIRYALLVFDASLGMINPQEQAFFMHHPDVSERSWLIFIGYHFQAYLSRFRFAKSLFLNTAAGTEGANEEFAAVRRSKILEERYRAQKRLIDSVFAAISPEPVPNQRTRRISLSETSVRYLFEIARILHHNNTDYRIILSPSYCGDKQSIFDILFLKAIFYPKFVWDFTRDYRYVCVPELYPGLPQDGIHYNRAAGESMLDKIYSEPIGAKDTDTFSVRNEPLGH